MLVRSERRKKRRGEMRGKDEREREDRRDGDERREKNERGYHADTVNYHSFIFCCPNQFVF